MGLYFLKSSLMKQRNIFFKGNISPNKCTEGRVKEKAIHRLD